MRIRLLLLFLLLATACDGTISGGARPLPQVDAASPFEFRVPTQIDRHTSLGLRRLDSVEYVNTVRDLLFVEASSLSLPKASLVLGLSNNQHVQHVSRGDLDSYMAAGDVAATQALSFVQLPVGCSMSTFSEACFDRWAPSFLERAMRHGDIDVAPFRRLFLSVEAEEGGREALRAVLQAVLISPSFLYRFETNDENGHLDDYAIATRLSYLTWSSMPDAELLAAAKAGVLQQPDARRAEATRLLADPRARDGAVHFVSEWLGTQAQIAKKGADILEGLDLTTLQTDLEAEQRAFVNEALLGPTGSVDTLLTAQWNYVSPNGARIMGLAGRDTLMRVDLSGKSRRGILTQPLLIAAHAKESGYSAVQLGRFTRERLLCQHIAPPPPGTDTTLPNDASTAGLGYREKLTKKTQNQPCLGCHAMLNPPGFAYMSYDPIGRHLEKDSRGVPFDSTGTLSGLQEKELPFTDLVSLVDQLSSTADVRGCFAERSIERAFGRTFSNADARLYTSLTEHLMRSNGQFASFITTLVTSPEFASAGPQEP